MQVRYFQHQELPSSNRPYLFVCACWKHSLDSLATEILGVMYFLHIRCNCMRFIGQKREKDQLPVIFWLLSASNKVVEDVSLQDCSSLQSLPFWLTGCRQQSFIEPCFLNCVCTISIVSTVLFVAEVAAFMWICSVLFQCHISES